MKTKTDVKKSFQGVVGGVLLVTPNAVMFDPNVSDPLVIEHGAESYGVIAPMEFVINAAIYYDIAHMRVSHTESGTLDKKPEIYYMKKPQVDNRKCQSPGKDENFPELAGDDSESVCSCAERDGDAFPKAFERELVTPTNLQSVRVFLCRIGSVFRYVRRKYDRMQRVNAIHCRKRIQPRPKTKRRRRITATKKFAVVARLVER